MSGKFRKNSAHFINSHLCLAGTKRSWDHPCQCGVFRLCPSTNLGGASCIPLATKCPRLEFFAANVSGLAVRAVHCAGVVFPSQAVCH